MDDPVAVERSGVHIGWRNAMQIQIEANNIVWTVQPQRSGQLVAWCDLLGLTVEGDNEADLASLIAESMHVLFMDLFEDGDLPAFLSEHGWRPHHPLPSARPDDGVLFKVPYGTTPAAMSTSMHP
jgi:hypothetical protein